MPSNNAAEQRAKMYLASRKQLVQYACYGFWLTQKHQTLANTQIIWIWQSLVYFNKTTENLQREKEIYTSEIATIQKDPCICMEENY